MCLFAFCFAFTDLNQNRNATLAAGVSSSPLFLSLIRISALGRFVLIKGSGLCEINNAPAIKNTPSVDSCLQRRGRGAAARRCRVAVVPPTKRSETWHGARPEKASFAFVL